MERLEPRALLAVTAGVVGSELLVNLSEANDTAVLQVEGSSYTIREGSQTVGSFSLAAVESIRVTGDAAKPGQTLMIKPGGVVADRLTVEAGVDTTVVNAPIVTSGSVSIGSAAITLGADVSSAGNQFYGGLLRLADDVVLDAGTSDIRFASEIRSTVGPRATLMEDLGAPNRIAVAPGGGVLYASDAVSNYVYFIDLASEQLDTVDLGKSIGHVALAPNGSRLYVANPLDGSVSVVDTGTRTAVATIAVTGTPEGMAVSADGRTLYVANYSEDSVAVVDTTTNRLVRVIAVEGSPTAVAVATNGRLWVASEHLNRVSVVDAGTGTVVAQIAVGRGPTDVTLSPDGTRAYVANNFDGTVSVIDTEAQEVVATIGVGSGPVEVAAASDGRLVYVVNGFSDSVSVIDTTSLTVATTASVGSLPAGLALSADGRTAYVANLSSLTELGNDARSLTVRTTGFAFFTAPQSTIDPLRALVVQASREVESVGAVLLSYDSAGNLRVNGTLVTAGGTPVNYHSYRSWGWTARAAERIRGVNTIAWQNEAGTLHFWRLTDSWVQTGADSMLARGTSQFWQAETDFGMDLDGNGIIGRGLTVIENVGNVTLGYDLAGNLLANESSITSFGAPVNYQTYLSWGWTARAAETIRGVTTIVWQNSSGDLHTWGLSANLVHQSSRGDFAPGSRDFNFLEADFGMDFNGDGIVASATTAIEDQGSVSLEYDRNGSLRANGVLVTSAGNAVNYHSFRSWGWTAMAAETVQGVNTIVWQNGAGQLHFWRLTADWAQRSADSLAAPRTQDFWTAETTFGIDFDKDGLLGSPETIIEAVGGVTLAYGSAGTLKANGVAITAGGNPVNFQSQTRSGYTAVAAEAVNGVNSIAWQMPDKKLHFWRLSSNWAQVSSDSMIVPGAPRYHAAEVAFGRDFDNDGVIGSPFTIIEAVGAIRLSYDRAGNLFANGTAVMQGASRVNFHSYAGIGFTARAAEAVGGVNTIAWVTTDRKLHFWRLSSTWSQTSSDSMMVPGAPRYLAAEATFGVDFDSSGRVGS